MVPWWRVGAVARRTVHDIRLGDALAVSVELVDELRPARIRRIAREIAVAGFAGRTAATAAVIGTRAAQARLEASQLEIVRQLARALDLPTTESAGPSLTAVSGRLGRAHAAVGAALQRLSRIMAEHGMLPEASDAPVPVMMADLARLAAEIGAFAPEQPALAAIASGVVAAAGATLKLSQRALSVMRVQTASLPALVTSLVDGPDAALARLERVEWLLDGWHLLSLTWSEASANGVQAQAQAIADIAELVPMLPDEADRWFELPSGTAARITTTLRPGPRRGVLDEFDAVARKELLRARAA